MLKKFFILTFIYSWILTGMVALQIHHVIPIQLLPYGVSWLAGLIPGIVALVLSANRKEFLKDNLRSGMSLAMVLTILMLTLGFLAVIFYLHLFIGDPIKLQTGYSFLAIQFFVWGILAFGEELGWRGWALPKLTEGRTLFQASLILGLIWCGWHYPKLLGSPYIKTWQQGVEGIIMFSIQILAGNFILCWLYFKSNRSVWATTLYHTLWNLVSTLYIFMAMDVFAVALIVVVAISIILLDRKTFFTVVDRI